jgi:hypothetical protein
MSTVFADTIADLHRVCVKIYAPEPHGAEEDAAAFVPVFHDWIRNRALDLVLIDVADYAHAPDSPGIMLVTHEISVALDRSDGRFGLLAQRRTPVSGGAVDAVASTLDYTLQVAGKLEQEPGLAGKLRFDRSAIRFEANDRLRSPNSNAGYEVFAPIVAAALERLFPGRPAQFRRVENDPRDRLAVEVTF